MSLFIKKAMLAPAFIIAFGLAVIPLYGQTETYRVSRLMSSVAFDVSAQAHNVHGESREFSGTITGDPNNITAARIEIKLDPASFNTKNEKRDKVMREKSLEVTKYPAIEFVSSSIESNQPVLQPGQPLQATIHGTLRLHGLEKEIAVPVTILWDKNSITAEGNMKLVLDEYSIFRPKVLFFRLQNDTKIHFKIGARKE